MENNLLKTMAKKTINHPLDDTELLKLTGKPKFNYTKGVFAMGAILTVIIITMLSISGSKDEAENQDKLLMSKPAKEDIVVIDSENSKKEGNNKNESEQVVISNLDSDTNEGVASDKEKEIEQANVEKNNASSEKYMFNYSYFDVNFSIEESKSHIEDKIKEYRESVDDPNYKYPFYSNLLDQIPVIEVTLEEINAIVPGIYSEGFLNLELYQYEFPEGETDYKTVGSYTFQDTITHYVNLLSRPHAILDINYIDTNLYLAITKVQKDGLLYTNSPLSVPLLDKYELRESNKYQYLDKYRLNTIYDSEAAMDSIGKIYYRNHLADMNIKSELMPVKFKWKSDEHYILWFYPTPDFISKLPARYRDDVREQYELYVSHKKQDDQLGETCVKIEGKRDYFGICGERRGAIESINFISRTTEAIAADIKLSESRQLKIYIANMMGNIVYSSEKDMPAGKTIEEFNISDLKAGPYFFVIESDAGELAIEKLFVE